MVELHNAHHALTKIVVDRFVWIVYDRGEGGTIKESVYSFEKTLDELAFSMYDRGRGGTVLFFYY